MSAAIATPPHHHNTLSLTEGGPFYWVLRKLRLRTATSMARCWWIGLFLWAPLVIGAGLRWLAGMDLHPMLFDLSLHVRLLVALPLFLSSELLLERATRSAMKSFYRGGYCDAKAIDPIVDRAEQLRDSPTAELVLAGVAVMGGQLVLWKVVGPTGLVSGTTDVGFWAFPRVWYAVVALPFVQFVMLRCLWRWIIWIYVLARLSRLPLVVLPTHADFAGGLGALTRPVTGFSGFFLATSTILASAWGSQLLANQTTLPRLLPVLAVFLVVGLLLAVGPLLLLSPHLFTARRQALAQYGDFMRRFTIMFHQKWIERESAASAPALVAPDFSSLHDLGESYMVVSKTRLFAFGPRIVLMVWTAGLVPMLPLLATTVSVDDVLRKIFTTVLGGFPV